MTSAIKDFVLRKSLGAWYTPVSIVRPLVKWAIRSHHDHVLDPAVGDGVFLVEAARALSASQKESFGGQLHGIDINENAVSASRAALAEVLDASDVPDLRTADFFQIEPPARLFGDLGHVDAVIGNPRTSDTKPSREPCGQQHCFGPNALACDSHSYPLLGPRLLSMQRASYGRVAA